MQCTRLKTKHLFNIYRRWNWKKYSSYSSIAAEYETKNEILGYSIKKVKEISELNLTAVLLEHKATAAEHLHLACEDSNNLFGVSFRTPPTNSNGVPHILEHLALCGSQKFPCRDPFFNMLTRSLSTFMNAFTTVDSTIYAFSSQNTKDFQNLLSVYLDASFFPLLKEKDFRQEGWRLEHENINDKNSPIILKGVVFNEMKGVFSDPNSYYYYNLQKKLFPTNTYSNVSGGEPLVIPTLSWESLKQFHAHHYHPSNSRFITYGNIPLETHLEQIGKQVLGSFQKLEICNEVSDEIRWTEPKEDRIYNKFDPMAAIPEKQTVISQSFLLDKITNTYESFALAILGTLLVDGPNAPFYQNLLESGIGPDFSSGTGYLNHLKQGVFSVGLREIAEADIDKVKNVIKSTFDEVINTGFPEERIKGVLHSVEIGSKHRTPKFGLNCALGINSLWNHNGCPISALQVNDHVQWFLKQMKENPHYLQDKVFQYFKVNNHNLTLIMSPKENFENEQQVKEKELLESRLVSLTDPERQQIYDKGLELAEHQKQKDVSCLPTLKIEDVKRSVERTPLKFVSIDDIPVQVCEQPTNEVVYFKALLDCSHLSEEDIMFLPLFCSVITQMGAGNRNYKELDQEIQLKTGSFNVSFHLSENPSDTNLYNQSILISSFCLEKNMLDMFSLWKDIFNHVCLEDIDRLSQLINLHASDIAQGVAHQGHIYAMRKACSTLTTCAGVREKTSGLSQINFMKKLAEMKSHTRVLDKLKTLANNLLHQKFKRCSLNATPDAMPTVLNNLDSFMKEINFSGNASPNTNEASRTSVKNQKSHFLLPLSVNHLGQSILTVPYNHPDFACLKVATKLLSTKFLHPEIREKGGAYGGGASLNVGGHFIFYSYRDPNVDRTLDAFSSAVTWLLEGSYSLQYIDEAKLGVFSDIDAPVAPGSKGQSLFQDEITDDMRESLRHHILNCTKEDIISATKRYLQNPKEIGTALIGPETKDSKTSWTII